MTGAERMLYAAAFAVALTDERHPDWKSAAVYSHAMHFAHSTVQTFRCALADDEYNDDQELRAFARTRPRRKRKRRAGAS